jgi:Domain of unknown function (DUF4331)
MIHAVQIRFYFCLFLVGIIGVTAFEAVHASDHLDTPTVIADPAADIGDLYAWTSSDGRRLNLVMDIVAHQFSNRLQYVFHVDSGQQFGRTTGSTTIVCRFDVANNVECWSGNKDYVRGDAHRPAGLESEKHTFRIFAGLRDDPFFNNVKGTREAYDVAGAALQHGTPVDTAGCPNFSTTTAQAILDTWRHTSGAPATNFLARWKTSAIVISIDLEMVTIGGKLAAVWGTVHRVPHRRRAELMHEKDGHPPMPELGEPIERTARPLIKNGLVGGPLDPEAISYARREAYNRVARTGWARFSQYIERNLSLYDGFDGTCGNQWLADTKAEPSQRYATLSKLFADDRLWVNTASSSCTQLFAVEFTAFGTPGALPGDCGGRTPNYNASNMFRSLLTNGTISGFDDGLQHDDKAHSTTEFPFLAAP